MRRLARGCCDHLGIERPELVGDVGIERDAGLVAITCIHVRDSSTRPLGISGVRDRVNMTAVLLVLEPIFEADLPSEIYAYRVGRNAQRAVVEMEQLLFPRHPDVVDADLGRNKVVTSPRVNSRASPELIATISDLLILLDHWFPRAAVGIWDQIINSRPS